MAPIKTPPKGHEFSSNPLADYFWIVGLDGQDVLDSYIRLGEVNNPQDRNSNDVQGIIVEDETTEGEVSSMLESPRPTSKQSKRNSYHRLSRLSSEAQTSARSLDKISSGASSARSSTTIRVVPSPSIHASVMLNDVDFDNALKKFANDRDSFFLDISFSAGAVSQPSRPRPRPRTQKIVAEDQAAGLSRGIGSVRRHMSFREMNSAKRQSSMARQGQLIHPIFIALPVLTKSVASVRTSRRTSNYNSVIPNPEPLEASPTMHPLKRKFEPVLLDRYPPKGMADESRRRGNFPDYVPMFAFPNDINVVSSDTRPRSTWHGFSMTAADNSRLHAICIIVWIPMNHTAADELEKRCEEWRRANMTDAERELASSLGERLAAERAKLSRLLSKLPYVDSGSAAREELEDEISAVEEKIVMMTDMLRPLRHGAASRIEGLTDGDTGLWIPRAYGILGHDSSMTSFWKEWLRAITVPMTDGAIMRVPPSSPRVGMWQPLEQYVINLCTEAPSPISSKTQVEIAIRELRLFARKEAINELPGSRDTDLYALFRALTIPNILILFEYVLAESRIILLSSHTSMLHLVSKAIVELIWPLKWAGVFIPVLPARLVQALEAPCPYICGIERRYEKVELPEDDFVLVDLDHNEIESTARPTPMPRQQRRKLMSLLQLAAPHHNKFGVRPGPPPYAVEAMPFDSFASENPQIFSSNAPSTSLARLVGMTSNSFGAPAAGGGPRKHLVLNAFLQARSGSGGNGNGDTRPRTGSTSRKSNTDSANLSPVNGTFPQFPVTTISRNDSGFALQSSLRDKRGGHSDSTSKGSGSTHRQAKRQPSLPFIGHSSNLSIGTLSPDSHPQSSYAPSAYAQSTLAASTIMPQVLMQPVRNTETTSWIEGHCLQWHGYDDRSTCSVCDEKAEDGIYRCSGCGVTAHARCGYQLYIVCPVAFFPEQVRAAFVRCFASLFYTYRKFMSAPTAEQQKSGMVYRFDLNSFLRSVPHENGDYIAALQQTQGERSRNRDPRTIVAPLANLSEFLP